MERGQAFLIDLRSTNGSKRNGENLVPLTPAPLQPGDRVGIGPFLLTVLGLGPTAKTGAFEARASEPRLHGPRGLFADAHPSDRVLRVRMAGEPLFLRVPASWMRACWQRAGDLPVDAPGDELGPMEEGAAQYVFDRVARTLAAELQEPIELSAWLSPADAAREGQDATRWLFGEIVLRSGDNEFDTTWVAPLLPSLRAASFEAPVDLAFQASVHLGAIRLRLGDLLEVEPGDALIPDVFWPQGFLAPGRPELGAAWLKVRSSWFGATLLRSEAGATLRLDKPWLRSPGEDWLMAEDDAPAVSPASLPVHDLELTVAIELDRLPVTLGELQKWAPGQLLSLRQGPPTPSASWWRRGSSVGSWRKAAWSWSMESLGSKSCGCSPASRTSRSPPEALVDASHEAWLLLRAFVALAAVLALAVVALRFGLPWLVRQRAASGEKQIVIEDVCLLDRGHRLYAVRWQGERFLIATSPERVELLTRRPASRENESTAVWTGLRTGAVVVGPPWRDGMTSPGPPPDLGRQPPHHPRHVVVALPAALPLDDVQLVREVLGGVLDPQERSRPPAGAAPRRHHGPRPHHVALRDVAGGGEGLRRLRGSLHPEHRTGRGLGGGSADHPPAGGEGARSRTRVPFPPRPRPRARALPPDGAPHGSPEVEGDDERRRPPGPRSPRSR